MLKCDAARPWALGWEAPPPRRGPPCRRGIRAVRHSQLSFITSNHVKRPARMCIGVGRATGSRPVHGGRARHTAPHTSPRTFA